jgi:hypothetical protein
LVFRQLRGHGEGVADVGVCLFGYRIRFLFVIFYILRAVAFHRIDNRIPEGVFVDDFFCMGMTVVSESKRRGGGTRSEKKRGRSGVGA